MKNIIFLIALLIFSSCNDAEILVPGQTFLVEDLIYLTDSTLLVIVTKENIDEIIKNIDDVEFDILNNDFQLFEKATIKWIINEKDERIGEINNKLNIDSLAMIHKVCAEIVSQKVKFEKNETLNWRISYNKISNHASNLIE